MLEIRPLALQLSCAVVLLAASVSLCLGKCILRETTACVIVEVCIESLPDMKLPEAINYARY